MERFTNKSPGALTMEQAIARHKKSMEEHKRQLRQARELAAQGRGDDTEVAHLTPGELVIPRALQSPELIDALQRAAAAHNIPLEMLSVGNAANRINPNTGAPEFDFGWFDRFKNMFSGSGTPTTGGTTSPGTPMSALPSVRDAAKNYDFSLPGADMSGVTPEMRQFTSPWKTIDKDMLTNILYNEMSSFRGDPQKLEQSMWATANTIMNRQAQGIEEDFKKKTLADPVISPREMQAIHGGNSDAKRMYDMASQVSDLITSAPDAFPSRWPYTQYNHRNTPSRADHDSWHTPVMVQYGPYDSYKGQQWLNIYGPPRR